MQTLLGLAGLVVALFGALFFTIAVTEVATGGDGKTSLGVYVGLVVFLGLTTAAGAWLAWTRLWRAPGRAGHRPPPMSDAEREQRILDLAERQGGRVTVAEVASRCDLTVDASKAALDQLVLHNIAELQVSERGVVVYAFPGFLSDEEKARAGDV